MGSKRTLGFCIKNGLVKKGDKIRFESGWETVVDNITPTEISTTNGSVFDFTTKIYPPVKKEVSKDSHLRKVTVTMKCVTYHEITVDAKDLQDGLINVDAMPRWTALKDAELIDYDVDTFDIEGVVIN